MFSSTFYSGGVRWYTFLINMVALSGYACVTSAENIQNFEFDAYACSILNEYC